MFDSYRSKGARNLRPDLVIDSELYADGDYDYENEQQVGLQYDDLKTMLYNEALYLNGQTEGLNKPQDT